MFFKSDFNVRLSNVGSNQFISNFGILSIFEESSQLHSASINEGINNIEKTGFSWVLLNWKVKVFTRPKYGDHLHTKTWARYTNKFYTYRDFELYAEDNSLVAIATSKWALIDINKKSIARITDEVIGKYEPENKSVFNELEVPRLQEPNMFDCKIPVQIRKTDIDINKHVHNLHYLNYAYNILPDNFVFGNELNNIEILYKKQIKFGDNVNTFYHFDSNNHFITLKSNNDSVLNAIIKLY